jgi:hypothetical protein
VDLTAYAALEKKTQVLILKISERLTCSDAFQKEEEVKASCGQIL